MTKEINKAFYEHYGRWPTEQEIAAIHNTLRESNVRDVAQIGGVIAAFVASGGLAAIGAAFVAKPVYDTARRLPIVGDVLGVLEDIFG